MSANDERQNASTIAAGYRPLLESPGSWPIDERKPRALYRYDPKRVATAIAAWHQGHAALRFQLNHFLAKAFPEQYDCEFASLFLAADEGLFFGLQYCYEVLREALTVHMLYQIGPDATYPSHHQKPTRSIVLRENGTVYPWCLGFEALGRVSGNLDQDFLDQTQKLDRRSLSWLRDNVVVPTQEQHRHWQPIFDEWQDLCREESLASNARTTIPPEDRTRPMSFKRAAKLMGYIGSAKKGAEWLSASVKDGSIACESLSRQQHVFSRQIFPKAAWPQILPGTHRATDPN